MNKLSALALGAALAVAAPMAVHAQETGIDLDLGGDSEIGVDVGGESGVGVDAGGEAAVGVDVGTDAGLDISTLTHADVDTAIQSSGSVNLDDVDASTDIEIVTVSSLSANDGGDASVLADTQAAFDADISALQDKVSANAELAAALESEGYTADDVIAVWTHSSGSLVLFVDA